MVDQVFDHSDIEMEGRDVLYNGFFTLEQFQFRHKRFDGGWSRSIKRELYVRESATCVLPYDPQTQQVLLIEQVRAGALLEDGTPWLIELVAGINDKGESPETIAYREAEEEAGISLEGLHLITEYLPSPGGSTEKVYLYCAKACLASAGGVFGLQEEDEDIRVHLLSLEDAYALVENGVISNAPAIIALQWLMLHRDQIQKRWASSTHET